MTSVQLKEGQVGISYANTLTAHTGYWASADCALYVLLQIYKCRRTRNSIMCCTHVGHNQDPILFLLVVWYNNCVSLFVFDLLQTIISIWSCHLNGETLVETSAT